MTDLIEKTFDHFGISKVKFHESLSTSDNPGLSAEFCLSIEVFVQGDEQLRSCASAPSVGSHLTLLMIARPKLRALVEPHALTRHAGDLKRPRGKCALCSTLFKKTRQQCRKSRFDAGLC